MATKSGSKHSKRPSVKHPSHTHPLRPSKVKKEDELVCSGCELDLLGSAYKCTKSDCEYFLHKSCFSLSPQITHKSHPEHPLILFFLQNEPSMFACDACREYGTAFRYRCSGCDYDVHIGCVSLPESTERENHEHPLKLFYSSSKCKTDGSDFICNECNETVGENQWVYYCPDCDYGTHLHQGCGFDEDEDEEQEEEEEEKERPKKGRGKKKVEPSDIVDSAADQMTKVLRAQNELATMNLHAQMAAQTAEMVNNFGWRMMGGRIIRY